MSGRIAVGVSGAGSNLRALHASAARGELDGAVILVFADRACPALEWAVEQGIDTALVPDGDDGTLTEALAGAGADVVVLAGYMRIVGPTVLAAFPNRIINTHPSLLPAFAGAHAVADALSHGAAVTGCTVHLVDETFDGGPIIVQEAVPILPGDDVATLHARIQAAEHRLLPRAAGLLIAGALSLADDGRHVHSTSIGPMPRSHGRAGRFCPCRTRPDSSSSGAGWSRAASSSSRPVARRGRCARRTCPSPMCPQ